MQYDRILLYFVLVLGLIAVSLWTLLLIQIQTANTHILDTLKLVNITKLDSDRRLTAQNTTDTIINDTHTTMANLYNQMVDYAVFQNNQTRQLLLNQNIELNISKELSSTAGKLAGLNYNLSKLNKENIENILNNISELKNNISELDNRLIIINKGMQYNNNSK